MTSNQHGPYVRGDTRVTMGSTAGCYLATGCQSFKTLLSSDRSLQLAFAPDTVLNTLTWPTTVTRRFIMQKARRHPTKRAPTACKRMVSGTISLLCSRSFAPFLHSTSTLSVSQKYLALRDGPRKFTQDSTCPALLRWYITIAPAYLYQTITVYGVTFQTLPVD
jgi:hypothetical protein